MKPTKDGRELTLIQSYPTTNLTNVDIRVLQHFTLELTNCVLRTQKIAISLRSTHPLPKGFGAHERRSRLVVCGLNAHAQGYVEAVLVRSFIAGNGLLFIDGCTDLIFGTMFSVTCFFLQ